MITKPISMPENPGEMPDPFGDRLTYLEWERKFYAQQVAFYLNVRNCLMERIPELADDEFPHLAVDQWTEEYLRNYVDKGE